jgi:3',5'-cyclic-nucleotide phosphodiesterase
VAALSLSKGCLTPDERRQIEEHVVDSYSFLVLIPWTRDLSGVPAIAHGHHEKLDGSGYPMGLRGPQISVQTRILTICDIWDALTAGDRPYKKAVPLDQAIGLMQEECNAGHIDGSLFQAFVDARAWMT